MGFIFQLSLFSSNLLCFIQLSLVGFLKMIFIKVLYSLQPFVGMELSCQFFRFKDSQLLVRLLFLNFLKVDTGIHLRIAELEMGKSSFGRYQTFV